MRFKTLQEWSDWLRTRKLDPYAEVPLLFFQTFQIWSTAFTDARAKLGDVELVLALWKANIPGDWAERSWKQLWGYRKNSKEGHESSGEKGIELQLLGEQGTFKLLRFARKQQTYPLLTAYHNFPLTKCKEGQVVSDALGVLRAERRQRPLLIEIKKNHKGPWHALVECLKQVKLARGSDDRDDRICRFLGNAVSPMERGAWGLVVAPATYYKKEMAECRRLLEALKKTHARIAFSALSTKEPELTWVEGNWE